MSNCPVLAALAVSIIISLFPAQALAQTPATPEQLILRPGDKIRWFDPSSGHVVQFGGGSLKKLSDIQKVLTFDPPLEIFDNVIGYSPQAGDPLITATVRADAAQSGVAAIDFTCGIHDPDMRSRLFQIAPANGQPPRELKIKALPADWVLETSGGDVYIDLQIDAGLNSSPRLAESHAPARRH